MKITLNKLRRAFLDNPIKGLLKLKCLKTVFVYLRIQSYMTKYDL